MGKGRTVRQLQREQQIALLPVPQAAAAVLAGDSQDSVLVGCTEVNVPHPVSQTTLPPAARPPGTASDPAHLHSPLLALHACCVLRAALPSTACWWCQRIARNDACLIEAMHTTAF